MRRGEIVVSAATGDYAKPRPSVVVQTNALPETHDSVVLCPITSTLVEPSVLRLTLEPSRSNGLRARSQVMIDKPLTVRRSRVGRIIGRLTPTEVEEMDRILGFVLGLGD